MIVIIEGNNHIDMEGNVPGLHPLMTDQILRQKHTGFDIIQENTNGDPDDPVHLPTIKVSTPMCMICIQILIAPIQRMIIKH